MLIRINKAREKDVERGQTKHCHGQKEKRTKGTATTFIPHELRFSTACMHSRMQGTTRNNFTVELIPNIGFP